LADKRSGADRCNETGFACATTESKDRHRSLPLLGQSGPDLRPPRQPLVEAEQASRAFVLHSALAGTAIRTAQMLVAMRKQVARSVAATARSLTHRELKRAIRQQDSA
jgi:hypothetical protein